MYRTNSAGCTRRADPKPAVLTCAPARKGIGQPGSIPSPDLVSKLEDEDESQPSNPSHSLLPHPVFKPAVGAGEETPFQSRTLLPAGPPVPQPISFWSRRHGTDRLCEPTCLPDTRFLMYAENNLKIILK